MPMNHGQSQHSTRWYKLCFMPVTSDSSDDSDTESVIIAPSTSTQNTTWQQPSPPHSPPHPEPEYNIYWLPLPPPPPPTFYSPLTPLHRSSRTPSLSPPLSPLLSPSPNPEPDDINWLPLPPPPLPNVPPPLWPLQRSSGMPSLSPPLSPLISPDSPPPNPEPQLGRDMFFSPPPPPLMHMPQLQAANSEPRINMQSLQPPPPPLPPPLPQDSRNTVYPFTDNVPPSLIEQVRPVVNQNGFLRIPDSVIEAIQMVTISELHERDEFSQCPICMEEFKLGDQACQLPCNHTYKFECILRWFNNNTTCPVCRLQLEGFTGQGSSYNINDDGHSDDDDDDDSLDLEPQIPQPPVNISLEDHFQFSPLSQVTENGADHNSDEGEYDSACDDLGDAHEGGE